MDLLRFRARGEDGGRFCNHAPLALDFTHGASTEARVPRALPAVCPCGNAREDVFLADPDRDLFLERPAQVLSVD